MKQSGHYAYELFKNELMPLWDDLPQELQDQWNEVAKATMEYVYKKNVEGA